MENPYNDKYLQPGSYWGVKPSAMAIKTLELMPPRKPLELLDIGCGEGRNAVFFARNGYEVTAFDLSPAGVQKTKDLAAEAGVSIHVFLADLNEFRLETEYDVLFSTGVLHYMPAELRAVIINNYKEFTSEKAWGEDGYLSEKGLIPMPAQERRQFQDAGAMLKTVSCGEVK